jgi:hypothetical protein
VIEYNEQFFLIQSNHCFFCKLLECIEIHDSLLICVVICILLKHLFQQLYTIITTYHLPILSSSINSSNSLYFNGVLLLLLFSLLKQSWVVHLYSYLITDFSVEHQSEALLFYKSLPYSHSTIDILLGVLLLQVNGVFIVDLALLWLMNVVFDEGLWIYDMFNDLLAELTILSKSLTNGLYNLSLASDNSIFNSLNSVCFSIMTSFTNLLLLFYSITYIFSFSSFFFNCLFYFIGAFLFPFTIYDLDVWV